MKKMILASIDIGSNTVLLLISEVNVAKNQIKTIANYYRVPRISQGLKSGEYISGYKIEELIKVLNEYKQICDTFSVKNILVSATNAFRLAANAGEIIYQIKCLVGLDVKVIDGDTEARLSFLGTVFPFTNYQPKTVIDIGGGSTEIIYGNNETIFFKKSFKIGVVSLTEEFIHLQPTELEDINKAQNFIKEMFSGIEKIPLGIETIAVAGTPTTLSCIKQGVKFYDELIVDNSILTYNELNKIIEQITILTPQIISESYGQVVEGREDILLAGCLILKIAMEKLGINKIKVSSKGLRYGILIDYMLNNNQ